MIDPKDYKQLAAALMNFALTTSNAAVEIENAIASGAELSEGALRMVAVWQGAKAPASSYMHPSTEAIAADGETEMFAIIVAERAMRDALDESALSPDLKLRALIRLARDIAPGGHVQVRTEAAQETDYAAVPYEVALRRMSKAFVMASSCAMSNKVMPAEMRDFVAHAHGLIEKLPKVPA